MTDRTYDTLGPGGVPTLTPYMSTFVNSYALTANTAATVTWPVGYTFCNIVGDGTNNYYVNNTTTAIVPVATVTTGAAAARNVAQRQRQDETTFSVISTANTVLTIEFWKGTQGV